MMNYSKSMKQIFRRLIPYIAVTAFAVIITILICNGCNATDEKELPETVGQARQTESITPMAQTTSAPIPKEPEPQIISLGEYRVTAYCGCEKCCGKWGKNRPKDENGNPIVYTANQSIAKEGVTIAADISVLPYGTKVIIDGHQYIVQDRGGSIEGNRVDIYFESHQAALEWGVQYKELFTERGENND